MRHEQPRILRFPRRGAATEREHYIPLGADALVGKLASDRRLGHREQDALRAFGSLLATILHREHHQRLESLKRDYAPFDPDAVQPTNLSPADRDEGSTRVFTQFAQLMQGANFRRLSDSELQAAFASSTQWGMRVDVDLNAFANLEVFVRGDVVGQWERCDWQTNYRRQSLEIPVFERLAVIFRLRDDRPPPKGLKAGTITIKLFKNIPQMDVETLLPGTRVRMSWFDQAKIFFPTLTGLLLALFKVFKGAVVFAFVGIYSLLASLAFVAGMIGYGVRSFFGYLNTKERYQHSLTRNLYYQNLDNNAGVLFRLLDEAEEQDYREALLAWFILWQDAPPSGWTAEEIDTVAEEKLRRWLEVEVDFEIDDALGKLERLGLARQVGSHWQATPLSIGLVKLERQWNELSPLRTAENAARSKAA